VPWPSLFAARVRRSLSTPPTAPTADGEALACSEAHYLDPAEAGAPWLLDPAVAADRLRAAGEDEDLLRRIDVAAPSRCARDERRTTSSGEAVVFAERCRAPFEGR